jgi:hypothetical protein
VANPKTSEKLIEIEYRLVRGFSTKTLALLHGPITLIVQRTAQLAAQRTHAFMCLPFVTYLVCIKKMSLQSMRQLGTFPVTFVFLHSRDQLMDVSREQRVSGFIIVSVAILQVRWRSLKRGANWVVFHIDRPDI